MNSIDVMRPKSLEMYLKNIWYTKILIVVSDYKSSSVLIH